MPELGWKSGWKSANEIVSIVQPGDVIEINMKRRGKHYLFNIRRGWCVHVVATLDAKGEVSQVLKDTTDLHQEAGKYLCRINNFEELAQTKKLIPRTLKNSLTVSRAGLAHGPIYVPLSDITFVTDTGNLAQEFCVSWKYNTPCSDEAKTLNKPFIIAAVLVLVAAACVAGILAVY